MSNIEYSCDLPVTNIVSFHVLGELYTYQPSVHSIRFDLHDMAGSGIRLQGRVRTYTEQSISFVGPTFMQTYHDERPFICRACPNNGTHTCMPHNGLQSSLCQIVLCWLGHALHG